MSAPSNTMRPAEGRGLPHTVIKSGRLAGAVGADQRDDLAARDLEVDAAQRLDGAVVGVDLGERKHQAGVPRSAATTGGKAASSSSPR